MTGSTEEQMRGPQIDALPIDPSRPTWSVMIPTFNCAKLLETTLRSILVQDPGSASMEIVVVDDISTKDDPEATVRRIAGDRVRFQRNPANLGAVLNFNRCIELSRGSLVHILHGDDFVAPTFYRAIGAMAEAHPECAFYATRAFGTDEEGVPDWITPRATALERPSRSVAQAVNQQLFQTPAVVVRRTFYEREGGFLPNLVHCADWEMWVRAIARGAGILDAQPLAYYRMFAANDTGRLVRTGENIRDRMRLAEYFRIYPEFQEEEFRRNTAQLARSQANRFGNGVDVEAERQNLAAFREIASAKERTDEALRRAKRRLVSTVKGR
ncbi:MAG: glycosyltransferase [Hyphomonadaceae bacterium]